MPKLPAFVNLPMLLAFVGGLLVIIAAFWLQIKQNAEKAALANQRLEFETALRKKSEEIAHLTSQVLTLTSGGEVDFYALPSFPDNLTDPVRLMVVHWSENPIYDLRVRVRDQNIALPFPEIVRRGTQHQLDEKSLSAGESQFLIGSIGPGAAPTFGGWVLQGDKPIRLSVWMYARNGSMSENLTVWWRDNRWHMALRAARDKDNGVIMESIDKDFPRTPDGKPKW